MSAVDKVLKYCYVPTTNAELHQLKQVLDIPKNTPRCILVRFREVSAYLLDHAQDRAMMERIVGSFKGEI